MLHNLHISVLQGVVVFGHNMSQVEDAIILAGGMGTRMLPASRYTSKEMLPLVDTPILHHLIWESIYAGVKRVHLVVSPLKYELLKELMDNKNKISDKIREDLPRISLNAIPEGVELMFHIQKYPGGVGEAISTALEEIKGPFLVLLGDNILLDKFNSPINSGPQHASTGCKKLVDFFMKTKLPCAAIKKIPFEELSKYGVVELNNGLIEKIIEKPDITYVESDLVLCGRYLLPTNYKEILKLFPVSEFGELQSIATFEYLIKNIGFGGIDFDNYDLYDSGDPVTWLKSQIRYVLKRPDLENSFKEWLRMIL